MQSAAKIESQHGPVSDNWPAVAEDENLTEIIKLMMDSNGPILVNKGKKTMGVITPNRVLRTIIEGTETS
jgi:predicted transcriptional regulator